MNIRYAYEDILTCVNYQIVHEWHYHRFVKLDFNHFNKTPSKTSNELGGIWYNKK